MDTDWSECVKVDQHLHVMRTKASSSHLCTKALLGFDLLAGGIYFSGDNILAAIHLIKGDNNTARPLPMKLLLPSEAWQSPIYELLIILLFVQGMSVVYTVAVVNALLSALVYSEKFYYVSIYNLSILTKEN